MPATKGDGIEIRAKHCLAGALTLVELDNIISNCNLFFIITSLFTAQIANVFVTCTVH